MTKVYLPLAIVIGVIFIFALPWIIWKGMQFRMRMTSFSNVRFDFAGALGQSYMNYLVYPVGFYFGMALLLVFPYLFRSLTGTVGDGASGAGGFLLIVLGGVITFLLFAAYVIYAFSFLKKKNTDFKINGARYGQGVFQTQVTLKKFSYIMLKTIIFALLLILAAYLILTVLSMVFVLGMGGMDFLKDLEMPRGFLEMNGLNAALPLQAKQILTIIAVYAFLIPVSMLIFAYPTARNRAYIYENTQLDSKIKFASTLGVRSLAWIKITNFFALIFTLGLAYPWVKVRLTRLMLENTWVNIDSGFDDYMTHQQDAETTLGDQIGDAFNIDIGIGF